MEALTDIHCHLIPAVDDGAESLDESLAMARLAVADGIDTIIATPHQRGNSSLHGDVIRRHAVDLQQSLRANNVPLRVLPGAEVRIEPGLVPRLQTGEILTLADLHKHVLIELPHELYVPIVPLLKELRTSQMVGIVAHPERNCGLMADFKLLSALVEQGGLLQVTANSLLGAFGPKVQHIAEQMLLEGLVHFVATDAHGLKSRRPILSKAFQRVAQLTDEATAFDLCARNPGRVVAGMEVAGGRRDRRRTWWRNWLGRRQLKSCA